MILFELACIPSYQIMLEEPYQVWIHIRGSNGELSGNGYDSENRAQQLAEKRVADDSNDAVILLDACDVDVVSVRVLKGEIDEFRYRLDKVFAGRWQVCGA